MQDVELEADDIANPYPLYAKMRAYEGLTRHRTDKFLFVSRYRDVREAAMRTDDFSSAIMSAMVRSSRLLSLLPDSFAESMDALAVADNPSHELHRRLMKRHFTRSPVADVMARVAPIINQRVDDFIRSGGGDFAVNLASVVPVETTLALLGFPLADAPKLKRIVDKCVELLAGQFPKQKRIGSFVAGARLFLYTRAQLAVLKAHPERATPVCAALLEALNDKVITDGLAPGLISQLIAAGVDSTASLLGNALRMLAENPELAGRLRADLSLVSVFLEECLRLESPFQGHFRVVRRPTELAGERLHPGERLMLMWGAANRDPEAFEQPDAVLLHRPRAAGSHVSFGYGYHLCLGAELARATAKYLVTRVLEGTASIALADAQPTLRPSPYLRTLTRLPLRVVTAQRRVA